MAHLNIYPICKLLECVKGLVLQIQNYRIYITHANNRISERSPCEDLLFIELQNPEVSYQASKLLQ